MRLMFSVQIGGVGHDVCESFLKVAWLLAESNLQTVEWCGDLTYLMYNRHTEEVTHPEKITKISFAFVMTTH